MNLKLRYSVLATIAAFSGITAQAAPITYGLEFKVESVRSNYPSDPEYPNGPNFFPVPVVGDLFHGSFTLDDAILATDGYKEGYALDAFRIEIASLVWDINVPSEFHGFRGPALGAISPVFIVEEGQITALYGGVYGFSDDPFIDFFEEGGFGALDYGVNYLMGDLKVVPSVPEPSSMALLVLGLGIAGFLIPRRKPAMLIPH